jgi:hypothetical protein
MTAVVVLSHGVVVGDARLRALLVVEAREQTPREHVDRFERRAGTRREQAIAAVPSGSREDAEDPCRA